MRERVLVTLALVVLAAFLWPTLGMPYLGDDTFNAYLDGWMGYEHLSLAEGFRDFFVATTIDVGRFYPIYPLLMFFDFHVVHSVVLLKALVLFAILVNAFTFFVLVRSVVPAFALPTLLALPMVFQIRFFHDPIVQFSLHMQVAWEFALLAALAIVLYGRGKGVAVLALGVSAYACAALTYEATYAFVVVYIALVLFCIRPVRARIVAIVSYAAVPIACSMIAIGIRMRVPLAATSQYALHVDGAAIARAVWLQIVGSLPLTFAWFDPIGFLPPLRTSFGSATMWIATIVVASLAAAAFARARSSTTARHAGAAIALAMLLVIASSGLIALSGRWQHELALGLAYTPVYFEEFGVALMLGVGATSLARGLPAFVGPPLATAIFGFTIAMTYRANGFVLAHYAPWSSIVPDALDAGVLAPIASGDVVYLDDSYPAHGQPAGGTWDPRYYLFAHTGMRLASAHLAELPSSVSRGSHVLRAAIASFSTGRVVAAPIASVARTRGSDVALIDRANIYDVTPAMSTLAKWRSGCGPIPVENVVDGFATALVLQYDGAFSFPERDTATRLRWASGPGVLRFENPTSAVHRAQVTFSIRPANAASHVRVRAVGAELDRAASSDVPVSLSLPVAPHASSLVAIESDNAPVAHNPGGRVLRYEIRDIRIDESACGARLR